MNALTPTGYFHNPDLHSFTCQLPMSVNECQSLPGPPSPNGPNANSAMSDFQTTGAADQLSTSLAASRATSAGNGMWRNRWTIAGSPSRAAASICQWSDTPNQQGVPACS